MLDSVVYNEDCMVGMKNYPNKWFDLAVVDPPYGIGEDGRNNHTRSKLAKAKDYRSNSKYDNAIPSQEYFFELNRISKNQIIWGGNYFLQHLTNTSCFIVWDKNNGENDFADCELAWTSFDTACRKFKWTWNGMLQENMKDKEERIHPNHKPIALYDWIYANYLKQSERCGHKHTKEYDHLCSVCKNPFKVIDTHLGSGSNRIAANKAGNIDFVGFELDKDYYEAQEKRWKRFISQTRLF